MAIYDFEDAIYPYDSANAKIENSWSWANLAQYANTPYNLTIKPNGASSNLLEHSSDIYGWVNNNGNSNSYAFKLKRNSLITKITADVRLVSYVNNTPVGFIITPFYLDTSGTYTERLANDYNYIQRDNGSYEIAQNHTVHITDDNWHSVEFPTDGSDISTHIQIYCVTNRSIEIKNIKIEGYAIDESPSGGAGSGYVGNSLLSNKKMVGYNVPTSDVESTKTESVNVYSASGESNKPKAGDGKVKIKLVKSYSIKTLEDIVRNDDFLTHIAKATDGSSVYHDPFNFSYSIDNPRTNDYSLCFGNSTNANPWIAYGEGYSTNKNLVGNGFGIPINSHKMYRIEFEYKFVYSSNTFFRMMAFSVNNNIPLQAYCYIEENPTNKQRDEYAPIFSNYNISWTNYEILTSDTDWHKAIILLNGENIDFLAWFVDGSDCYYRNIVIYTD